MRNKPFILILVYCFFLLAGRVYGLGEKTIIFGSGASWELMEKRRGVVEASGIRPNSVLVLSSHTEDAAVRAYSAENFSAGTLLDKSEAALAADLHLSFDEGNPARFADAAGRYDVAVSPLLASAPAPWSRAGTGAALFSEKIGDEPIVLKPRGNALFAPGSYVRDFSVEFWLFPQSLEYGEQILSFDASRNDGLGGYIYQRIQCVTAKNRLEWTFADFFFSPGGQERKSLSFSGPPVLPRTWSHHLIRFDADLGLLEYLVDGKVEVMEYTTSSGKEGGDVYTPVIGQNCRLVLGRRFSGMMDEFRLYRFCLNNPALAKYPESGGRAETRTLDLGHADSRILRIDASGGRTSNSAGASRNEYAGSGALRFSDHAAMQFFIRTANSPYRWNDVPWIPFSPGTELAASIRGRYVQLAVDFYPGWDGETSPYLSELKMIYLAAEPPPPPAQIIAAAKDGAVELSWRASSSREAGGYLVYYGTAKGEYFGAGAIPASALRASPPRSPVDAGNRTSIRIEGLNNGTLYYFAVAAYNAPVDGGTDTGVSFLPEPGEFSREIAARPLRMAE